MQRKLLIMIMFFAGIISSCTKKQDESKNDTMPQAHDMVQEKKPIMQIDTTVNLIVFQPRLSHVELEVCTMPSIENDSVIFCIAPTG